MKLSKTCGAATLVAVLAVGNSAYSQTLVTLSSLLTAGSITSGDLVFSGFSNFTQGGGFLVSSSAITVTVVSGGIQFSSSPQWDLSGTSLSAFFTLNFNVATTDGSFITGLASTLSGTPTGQGQAGIDDEVTTARGGLLGQPNPYINQAYTGSTLLTSSVSFASQSTVSVAKVMAMSTGGTGTPTIIVNNFSDTFVTTAVPEPSSMALLGSFGGLGLFLLRRRN